MREQDGFTLVELVVTLTLGALAVLALARGLSAAYAGGRSARATTQASAQARSAIEQARALGYDVLAHTPGSTDADPNVTGGAYDPDGSGPLAAEDIVERGDGELDPYTEQVTYAGITYTLRTYVTQTDDAGRRVSALVEWTERGRPRSITMSTIVPPALDDVVASGAVKTGIEGGVEIDEGEVEVDDDGGVDETDEPDPSGCGETIAARAEVNDDPSAHVEVHAANASVSLAGLTIVITCLEVEADATPGSTTVSATGSLTINGVTYTNPPAGLYLNIAGYRVILNDERREADGSMSIAGLRVEGADTELVVAWAWVRPV